MKISLYICVKNALFLDYHFKQMVNHHLGFADEVIINDGGSTDGTYEWVSCVDPKVKAFQSDWGEPKDQTWFAEFKNEARIKCQGDWCILLDPDEFIPEWEFDRIRRLLETTERHIVRLDWIHFYGNYLVYNANPSRSRWALYKYQIHRNLDNIEVWGDGSNVRIKGAGYESTVAEESIQCHHFGMVRRAARLRQKLRYIGRIQTSNINLMNLPSIIFDLFPYNWLDPDFIDDLEIYDGPLVWAVRNEPNEFVRDGFKLLRYLKRKKSNA